MAHSPVAPEDEPAPLSHGSLAAEEKPAALPLEGPTREGKVERTVPG